jgi:hypothetical protein
VTVIARVRDPLLSKTELVGRHGFRVCLGLEGNGHGEEGGGGRAKAVEAAAGVPPPRRAVD